MAAVFRLTSLRRGRIEWNLQSSRNIRKKNSLVKANIHPVVPGNLNTTKQ